MVGTPLSPSRLRNIFSVTALLLVLVLMFAPAAMAQAPVQFDGIASVVNTSSLGALSGPRGAAVDRAGNLYVSDTGNSRVIEVSSSGAASILTLTGLTTPLRDPIGLGTDASGDLFIADTVNSRIVEVTPSGAASVVSTGSETLADPFDVKVDASGNLFVADTINNRIVEIGSSGTVSLVSTGTYTLNRPVAVAVDGSGDVYISDAGSARILEVASGGTVSVVYPAGLGSVAIGVATGLTVDASGNLFIANSDTSNPVVEDSGGSFSVVNMGTPGGTGLSQPGGVAIDGSGNLYATDSAHNRVVELGQVVNFGAQPIGTATTPLGLTYTFNAAVTLGGVSVSSEGTSGQDFQSASGGTCAAQSYTAGQTCTVNVSFQPGAPGTRLGGVILADSGGNIQATTYMFGMGQGPAIVFPPGTSSVLDLSSLGAGSALGTPYNVRVDEAGNVYIPDFGDNRIVKIAAGGTASVLNIGTPGGTGLNSPNDVALDGAGNLYIADYGNNRIVVVPPVGPARVLGTETYTLSSPSSVAVDPSGNVFISDTGNNRIVEITGDGNAFVVNTGTPGGTALNQPNGTALDSNGNLFISDTNNNRVVELSASGVATVLTTTTTDGTALKSPGSVAVDSAEDVYIADSGNNRIVEIPVGGAASVLAIGTPGGAALNQPWGVAADGAGNVYVADTNGGAGNNGRIVKLDLADAPTVPAFASTKIGATSTDSPKTVAVGNFGDLPLNFAALDFSTNFIQQSSGGTDCAATTVLAMQTTCNIAVGFQPTEAGNLSGTVKLTDDALNQASPSAVQTITLSGIGAQVAPTITLQASATSLSYGQPLTLTATVTQPIGTDPEPTGTVTFLNGTASLGTGTLNGSGVATLALPSLAPGTYLVTAKYAGDTNYLTVTSAPPLSITVSVGTSILTFVPSVAQIVYGTPLGAAVLDASVSGGIAGTIGYTAKIGSGAAQPVTPASVLPVATYTITATFTPADPADYQSATKTAGLVVVQAPLRLAIGNATRTNGAANPPFTSVATGLVNGDTIGGDITVIYSTTAVANSPAGTYPITATLSGTAAPDYSATIVPGTLTVTQDTLVVAAANATRMFGASNPVFTGTVMGAAAGDIFTESFSTTAQQNSNVGTYAIVPAVAGANLANYTVQTIDGTLTVTQAASKMALSATANTIVAGMPVTLTSTVSSTTSGVPTGAVVFANGAASLGTATLNAQGVASMKVAKLPTGLDTITASYSGDRNFTASQAQLGETVTAGGGSGSSFIMHANPSSLSLQPSETGVVTLTLTPASGNTGSVNFKCAGLPAYSHCSFNPANVTFDGSGKAIPVVLTIATDLNVLSRMNVPSITSSSPPGSPFHRPLGGVPMVLGLMLWCPGAMKDVDFDKESAAPAKRSRLPMLAVLLVLAVGLLGIVGCNSVSPGYATPAGQYTVTVTAAGTGGPSRTVAIQLNIL